MITVFIISTVYLTGHILKQFLKRCSSG